MTIPSKKHYHCGDVVVLGVYCGFLADFLTSGVQEQPVHFTVIFSSQFSLIGLIWFGQVDPAWNRT